MSNHDTPPRPIRLAEALRQSGLPISLGHVSRLIRAGRVPAQRIGGLWYVKPDDLISTLAPTVRP
jgi:hypothetical protein